MNAFALEPFLASSFSLAFLELYMGTQMADFLAEVKSFSFK